ncbi:hypothetical protein ABHA40_04135, partial [Enterococcus mundtii]|uniref:hypothetical protein n=1 Tax=Enterococcus mundtii TaxID=53346 RepID=UPI00325AD213
IYENCSSNFCGWRLISEEVTSVPAVYSILGGGRELMFHSLFYSYMKLGWVFNFTKNVFTLYLYYDDNR